MRVNHRRKATAIAEVMDNGIRRAAIPNSTAPVICFEMAFGGHEIARKVSRSAAHTILFARAATAEFVDMEFYQSVVRQGSAIGIKQGVLAANPPSENRQV